LVRDGGKMYIKSIGGDKVYIFFDFSDAYGNATEKKKSAAYLESVVTAKLYTHILKKTSGISKIYDLALDIDNNGTTGIDIGSEVDGKFAIEFTP
jgi:hypothetical protein